MTKVDNIIKAYANDLEGLTREECLDEDFSAKQCDVLETALDKGAEGIITPEEKTALEQAGFAKDFIQDLTGTDGKKALQSRVKWLGEHIGTKWYRPDDSPSERRAMMEYLGYIGPDAKDSVPALINTLKDEDEDEYVRSSAAIALGQIGPDAKDSVPSLINTLKDEKPGVRSSAAYALGKIGPGAKVAVPALIDALKDEDFNVRGSAALALGRIGKDAVPALIDALKDQDWNVRANAAWTLGNIGKQAFFAIPVLQEMAVSDPENDCRILAKKTLEKMMGEIR